MLVTVIVSVSDYTLVFEVLTVASIEKVAEASAIPSIPAEIEKLAPAEKLVDAVLL